VIFFQTVFFVFFAVFFPLYALTRDRLVVQNALILVGSYIFYGWWDPRFLILIAISTAVDFICGRMISGERPGAGMLALPGLLLVAVLASIAVFAPDDALLIAGLTGAGALVFALLVLGSASLSDRARARTFVTTSIAVNLGILGVFKYFDFFAAEFATLAGTIGWTPGALTLDLILPVGISFYTFQTMSYTLDIYRRQLKPTNDLLQFAAFVSFFPQLVAGPIERARNLLPQFAEIRQITVDGLRSGAMLFIWGFYKKVAIADNLAPISDRIFTDPAAQDPGVLMAGVLGFTFQIYCDFSGYSDMARGLARMLGFELMVNFRMPYFARTPSEFWQRWHISLSSWLRDYLYIPLGGNRGTALATYRNLAATMLLGGFWHGAAWTFIAWGALHGGLLVIYRVLGVDGWLEGLKGAARLPAMIASGAVMFAAVMVGWVFFRAASFGDAFHIIGHMWLPAWSGTYGAVAFAIGPLVLAETAMRLTGRSLPWERLPVFVVFNILLFLICSIVFLGVEDGQSFIYFDF